MRCCVVQAVLNYCVCPVKPAADRSPSYADETGHAPFSLRARGLTLASHYSRRLIKFFGRPTLYVLPTALIVKRTWNPLVLCMRGIPWKDEVQWNWTWRYQCTLRGNDHYYNWYLASCKLTRLSLGKRVTTFAVIFLSNSAQLYYNSECPQTLSPVVQKGSSQRHSYYHHRNCDILLYRNEVNNRCVTMSQ